MNEPALRHGLTFPDLYERDGLIRLDRAFVAHLANGDAALHERLMAARADPGALDRKSESELLGISPEVRDLQARHDKVAPLYSVKRLFVQRRALREVKEAESVGLNGHK